ncbi:MAG: RNA 2',3'-cyclic phosphodiesterase [Rhodospirillales bacterium]|nr:RNA 2',3'-cyclic phosphodiesterase [Rhodospirillales bacterium]
MVRLFVGVELPEDVRMRLAALCAGVPGAKWVPAQNLHLTLRFIGEVPEGEAEDIDHALSAVRPPRFEINLAGVSYFETAGQVRALWAGVEKSADLTALHKRVESALIRIGLDPEDRRFTPHITLARLRDAPLSRVSAFLSHHALFRAGPIPVDHFTLYSSYLQSSGAIHTPEAEYPLAYAY